MARLQCRDERAFATYTVSGLVRGPVRIRALKPSRSSVKHRRQSAIKEVGVMRKCDSISISKNLALIEETGWIACAWRMPCQHSTEFCE